VEICTRLLEIPERVCIERFGPHISQILDAEVSPFATLSDNANRVNLRDVVKSEVPERNGIPRVHCRRSASSMTPSRDATAEMRLHFFYTTWCGVCQVKGPVVREIARAVGLPLEAWNIEEPDGEKEAERRRIRTVPTLALVRGERVPFRLVGSMITPENARHLLAQVVDSAS
jgi:thioredoxin 1